VVCGRSYPRIFRFLLNPTGPFHYTDPKPFVDPIGEEFLNILLGIEWLTGVISSRQYQSEHLALALGLFLLRGRSAENIFAVNLRKSIFSVAPRREASE
jgi:hypothetical protein